MRAFCLPCIAVVLLAGCGDSGDAAAGGSRGKQAKYYETTTRQTLEKLSESLAQFKQDKGRYPTAQEGLKELRKMTPDGNKKFSKPYTNNTYFVDAWGFQLYYTPIGDTGFELRSAGPDATLNTSDDLVVEH